MAGEAYGTPGRRGFLQAAAAGVQQLVRAHGLHDVDAVLDQHDAMHRQGGVTPAGGQVLERDGLAADQPWPEFGEPPRRRLGADQVAVPPLLDVRRIAAPELLALSRATGETATLSIRAGDRRVYVDQVTPDREVIMSVSLGVPHPLHAGASSKAFLAFLDDDEVGAYLADNPLTRLTDRTVTDPGVLRRELRTIRRRGYAQSAAERQPGAASVAAPVLDHHGRPAAVISVCGPRERFRAEARSCTAALLDATARLSVCMGHTTDRG